MVLTDSASHTTLEGDYGFYNELTDSAYVTGRALAKEYSQGDTLYMHGREIFSFRTIDTVEAVAARVIADSISPDSVAYRHIPPVMRPDTNQVTSMPPARALLPLRHARPVRLHALRAKKTPRSTCTATR